MPRKSYIQAARKRGFLEKAIFIGEYSKKTERRESELFQKSLLNRGSRLASCHLNLIEKFCAAFALFVVVT